MRRFILCLMCAALLMMALPLTLTAQDDCPNVNLDSLGTQADDALDREDNETAIRLYTCAIAEDNSNPDFFNGRGIAYYNLEMYTEALEDFVAALELDPNYPYAHNNRANIFYIRGNYDRAIEGYTRSIEMDGANRHIPYYNRGSVYQELGDFGAALEDLSTAIDIDPEYADTYLSRASVYLALSDERAYADFAEYLRRTQAETVTENLYDALAGGDLQMADGLVYRLTFVGEAGQMFNASASVSNAYSLDPLLVLLDPEETAVIADDDSGVNLNAVIEGYTLPSNGTYTLLVGQAGGGDDADGLLTLIVSLGTVVLETGESVNQEADLRDFATYNLFVDTLAEVYTTAGDRLNLRSGPGLDFEVTARLERGALVTLLEGPRKTDGYAWWNIRTEDGTTGWAVERADEEQTLQLALLVGENAVVYSPGERVNVRAEPARQGELLFQIDDGDVVTLRDTPVVADNLRWWPIRTADGREGWMIDRLEGERVLIPAREFE
ncbi:MAG: hypothetical protein OHK0046_51170 [Anaerolineae bacterium]